MVSEANLEGLRRRSSRSIVGTPKSGLKPFERQLLVGSWRQFREGFAVQMVPADDGRETLVLCRSADRAATERALRQQSEQRIKAGLETMQRVCETRRSAWSAK